ncbi:MAG TPA: endonuclease MutS2 [Bryobacterales bacterium]|nr:endonuclease MutS2 [Bryobacterales bacterium]
MTVEEVLEFPQVLEILRRYAGSPLGVAALEKLRPLPEREQAERELAEAGEAMEYLRGTEQGAASGVGRAAGPPPIRFGGVPDVRQAAVRLGIEGAALEPLEIFHLVQFLERAGDIKTVLAASGGRFPRLAQISGDIAEFRPLVRDLAGKILPNGQLEDHASGALRRIRREIEQQKRAIHASLERFMRAHSEEGSLQEDYVTIRNDRLVVPVKAEKKRRIDGVIHAASSTGQTLFVEPLETIELNNDLVRLAEEETAEIHRILREMTARLAHYAGAIAAAIDALGKLDLLFAKARFGVEFGATIPRFSPPDAPLLRLRGARHPLLEDLLRRGGRSAVPASLTMDGEHRVLIISGPNTGGKTVTLKTVGLAALMAQAGLPVPAEEAELPWFEQVLADIGDYQSIQDSLSTFSAHIGAIREMIEKATAGSLVLIDEMGAATDPQEGGALGVAVVEHFRRAGAFTLVSTHLPALKAHGASTAGVLSASVGFNEETLEPNYRLEVGLPGKSAGLDIARRLGIPAPIIARAQQALTSQDLEVAALLAELHRRADEHRAAQEALENQRRELERKEREIQREWEKRETAKLKELERRVDLMLAKFDADAKGTIEKIAEAAGGRKAAAEASRKAARIGRGVREEFAATVLESSDEARQGPVARGVARVEEGATVRLRGVGTTGRVRRKLAGDKLEVEVGLIKMQVDLDEVLEVIPAGAAAASKALPGNVTFRSESLGEASVSEINVIGATAEEARDRVDKFLDTAVLAALPKVRVVHGHGMGILRKALWEMFATHPHVEKYYAAEQREGGTGATVVELRV